MTIDCSKYPPNLLRRAPVPMAIAVVLALLLAAMPQPARAQADPVASPTASTDAGAASDEADPDDAALVSAEDVRALVAPVALYPDPMLALVLQASTQPLQVVQASRFLERRAADPTLTPDQDWDSSVLGLLNYPQVLDSMNSYLDWTSELGDAVITQLEDVQDAILDIRTSAAATEILVSNDVQKVVVENDVVRILPADANTVSVPEYDPTSLLEAITPEAAAEELPAADAADAASEAAEVAAGTEETGEVEAEAQAPSPQAAPAYEGAPAAAPPAAYPAAYGAPPVVSYGEPQSGFWDDAATFAGGAVVGGLLGWGLTEAFDDDDDDWYRGGGGRNVNIEDSNIVVGDRRRNAEIQNELRGRRGDVRQTGREVRKDVRQESRDVRKGDRQTNRTGGTDTRQPRDGKQQVRLPSSGPRPAAKRPPARAQAAQATASNRPKARPAARHAAPKKAQGLGADVGSASQVKKQANRGAASRVKAQHSTGGRKAIKQTPSGRSSTAAVKKRSGGGGMASNVKRGGNARADASRGRSSRHAKGGGGGRGKRGR